MLPILFIHGYSSEGSNTSTKRIYGKLPSLLKKAFGPNTVKELNISRWISLSNGVSLDDVSFAMDRALKKEHPELLTSGFHVVIHSTGALVVRNWIRLYSSKPCPIGNLVHLAGANMGSGLATIGKGQLARWGRFIFAGTGAGTRILRELEFGNWKTLDIHLHFLQPGNTMHEDYQVQEYCLNGSQVFSGLLKEVLSIIPIRYVKEDSSDNTVRTTSCNLNIHYIPITPTPNTYTLSARRLLQLVHQREKNHPLKSQYYDYSLDYLSTKRPSIPFAVLYETAHFGSDIGIMDGKDNRSDVIPHIKTALETPIDAKAYQKVADQFQRITHKTMQRASKLKASVMEWDRQSQYEGHCQIIFRLRDQCCMNVNDYDITFQSSPDYEGQPVLEKMIEDKHINSRHSGTSTYYLRTVKHDNGQWIDLLNTVAPLELEITAYESLCGNIAYVPLSITLDGDHLRTILSTFCTTIIDVNLMRLPTDDVFSIEPA